MQHTIHAFFHLIFITLIALGSSIAALYMSGTSFEQSPAGAWAVGAVALAAFTIQSVLGKVALAGSGLRWLFDPRAAAEGLWIERVETPGGNGDVTYSLLSVEYNSEEDSYVIHIWNFDRKGRVLRWLTSTQIDFGSGNKRILYRYQGHRLVRSPDSGKSCDSTSSAGSPGIYAQDCHGFGWLVFSRERFGKYSFARGEFIDCSLRAAVTDGCVVQWPSQMRSAFLRRIRTREIYHILTGDGDMRDPMPRMRGSFTSGPYRGIYKNHDLSRIAMYYRKQAMCQDENLAENGAREPCGFD